MSQLLVYHFMFGPTEFESHETAAAWRAHPEHREAQRLGRERWFTEYRITVCDVARDYSFKA
jgi:heme-degrading monooxygenase HmoA